MNIFADANILVSVINKEYPLFPLTSRILSLGDNHFGIPLITRPGHPPLPTELRSLPDHPRAIQHLVLTSWSPGHTPNVCGKLPIGFD